MKNAKSPKSSAKPRQIVGFSLLPELAVEVKMEAARRSISLRELFVEMWRLYRSQRPA